MIERREKEREGGGAKTVLQLGAGPRRDEKRDIFEAKINIFSGLFVLKGGGARGERGKNVRRLWGGGDNSQKFGGGWASEIQLLSNFRRNIFEADGSAGNSFETNAVQAETRQFAHLENGGDKKKKFFPVFFFF